MSFKLTPFEPINEQLAVTGHVVLHGHQLTLSYQLLDPKNTTKLQAPDNPAREIGLWNHTCFEFFIKNTNRQDYLEFNVSPNHHWNAFYFRQKGDALTEYSGIPLLRMEGHDQTWGVTVDTSLFPEGFWQAGQMNLGVTTVLEDKKGALSYWALTHKENKPNFHNFDSFIIKL